MMTLCDCVVREQVFLCGRSPDWPCDEVPYGPRNNVYRRPNLQSLDAGGGVTFANGWRAPDVTWVVYATGYDYCFPFLEESGLITVRDNTCAPLSSTRKGKEVEG